VTSTAAHRQRRYRAHSNGDHTLCLPDRECRDGVTSPATPVTREAFKARGRRLWDEMGGGNLSGGRKVLLEEACRLADRLDGLDRLISGTARDWLEIVESKGDPERQELVVDKLLAEARQQAVALKQIVTELRAGAASAPDQPATGVSFRDQLAARRAARRADATGS
jgi:hypothetical protein